jgi:hypothetical protein
MNTKQYPENTRRHLRLQANEDEWLQKADPFLLIKINDLDGNC